MNRNIRLYFVITAIVGLALGLSDAIFANYFKEVYLVDALQRGLIEIPRELPGMLCMFLIMALAGFGDIGGAVIAQVLCTIGLVALGFLTPPFGVMLVFLFIYSAGMHLYMPLGDSIGLSLAEGVGVGRLMGRVGGCKTGFTMLAGVITFIGFKTGFLGFHSVFLLSACGFAIAAVLLVLLLRSNRRQSPDAVPTAARFHVRFDKRYANYYFLCILYGARKQIMFVYSPWVLIELLGFKADTMSLLAVAGAGIGIFFMPVVGRWIDRFGVQKIMVVESLAFIAVYILYGGFTASLVGGVLASTGLALVFIVALNIVDKMTAQFAMVRSIYMREIAVRPEDVTPSLALGLSLDHVVSITGSAVCGWIWYRFGPQYVFVLAAVVSALNLLVALRARITPADSVG